MKLTLLSSAFVAALCLTVAPITAHAQAAAAPAATTPAAAAPAKAAKSSQQFGGKVVAVDASASTIEVKSKKHDLKLTVDASTKYKNATALSDFAVGDKVSGSYAKDSNTVCLLTKKAAK
jgi:hypothetical protein